MIIQHVLGSTIVKQIAMNKGHLSFMIYSFNFVILLFYTVKFYKIQNTLLLII